MRIGEKYNLSDNTQVLIEDITDALITFVWLEYPKSKIKLQMEPVEFSGWLKSQEPTGLQKVKKC